MDNYAAIVSRVEDIHPIPGADRIVLLTVNGEQVIAQKDLWSVGDVGIFFPTNVVLSHDLMMYNNLYRKNPETDEPMGGYMEADRRVRYIRMKGVGSRGLFLPVTALGYIKQLDASALLLYKGVGFEFNDISGNLICEKYIASAVLKAREQDKNQKVGKTRSIKFVNFPEIGDTPRLTTNARNLKDGDILVVTEKLHGTSARTGYAEIKHTPNWADKLLSKFGYEKKKQYKYVSGTRRTVIGENSRDKFTDVRLKFHNLLLDKLRPGMVIYYEIVGPGVMPAHNASKEKDIAAKYGKTIHYNYGLNEGQYAAYIYKIVEHTVDGRPIVYSWEQLVEWCNQYELNHVPEIERIVYQTESHKATFEMITTYADQPTSLGGMHPREGVVVHTIKGPRKFKGDTFCTLEGIMLNSDQYIDPEELV